VGEIPAGHSTLSELPGEEVREIFVRHRGVKGRALPKHPSSARSARIIRAHISNNIRFMVLTPWIWCESCPLLAKFENYVNKKLTAGCIQGRLICPYQRISLISKSSSQDRDILKGRHLPKPNNPLPQPHFPLAALPL
jgi:hypothetical protein